ncbi:YesL family protein [Aquibacillus salsiterrae]|uniref:YesL family protein n=1 Tax=Aquibacillus salsiterrae TaxID=2950439 RepID=A0A9X3WFE1_9BACI|nr:YesL family protein [Aquibacillus salsiterrae]MDC3416041.1 YesL family protein [Aquibacillus salsiterrae]
METGVTSGFYNLCLWIFRFAYLNIIWILFCVLGLVIVGFFPATTAMLMIERKWLSGEKDIPIFQTFCSLFRQEFLKSNLLGFPLITFGILLYLNYLMLTSLNGLIVDVLTLFLIGLVFLYAIVVIYIFPVYIYYDVKYMDNVKYAFFIGISSPLMSLFILLSVVVYLYIGSIFPGIIPLYSGSVISFAVMWFTYCAFKRIEQKHIIMFDEGRGKG